MLKKSLKPGDFVSLVPLGIPMTLQYNISGNLEKVYIGYKSDREDVTEKFMMSLISQKYVPASMQLKKGTSWVEGILYTNELIHKNGKLPDVVIEDLCSLYFKNPSQFNFFAFNIECTSFPFLNYQHISQYLKFSKFYTLPAWLVPVTGVDSDTYERWLSDSQYTFNKIVMNYAVFTGNKVEILPTGINHHTVITTTPYVDDEGYYKIDIRLEDDNHLYYPYNKVRDLKLGPKSVIFTDSRWHIVYSMGNTNYPDHIKCPYCGKVYTITDTDTICPDIHCTSRLVRPVERFINVLNLPKMDTKTIRKLIDNDDITCIPDVLILDNYRKSMVSVDIAKVLESMIPNSYIRNNSVYKAIVLACTNNLKTFLYYVDHPDSIVSDLKITNPDISKVVTWLSDDSNAMDLKTVITSDQIDVTAVSKRFNGAPIFRDKLIYITGDFIHGSQSDISEILESYSAKVTTIFTNLVDCVLIGGTMNGANGKAVNSAKNIGIPIMQELEFFERYDIDSDLNNLV